MQVMTNDLFIYVGCNYARNVHDHDDDDDDDAMRTPHCSLQRTIFTSHAAYSAGLQCTFILRDVNNRMQYRTCGRSVCTMQRVFENNIARLWTGQNVNGSLAD